MRRARFFGAGDGAKKLADFDAHWAKCRSDQRLPPVKHFRDKYTAHLGEPQDIPEGTYRDLFDFGAETAKAMELLALAAGVAVKSVSSDPGVASTSVEFW